MDLSFKAHMKALRLRGINNLRCNRAWQSLDLNLAPLSIKRRCSLAKKNTVLKYYGFRYIHLVAYSSLFLDCYTDFFKSRLSRDTRVFEVIHYHDCNTEEWFSLIPIYSTSDKITQQKFFLVLWIKRILLPYVFV